MEAVEKILSTTVLRAPRAFIVIGCSSSNQKAQDNSYPKMTAVIAARVCSEKTPTALRVTGITRTHQKYMSQKSPLDTKTALP
jgi:hypothetical protein